MGEVAWRGVELGRVRSGRVGSTRVRWGRVWRVAALEENNLSAFMGADATRQPGDLKDLMLHETAVAWLDDRLTVTTPSAAWDESVDAFGSRLKQACEYINANHEVENLCRELPQRLLTLRQKEGARLKK